jgi:peptidoglycan hydrolase CwlO-like protein
MLKTMEAPSKDLMISLLTPMDRRHRSVHESAVLAALMVQGVKLSDEIVTAMSVVGDAVSAPLGTDIQCLENVARAAKDLVQRLKGDLDDSQTVVEDLQGRFKESQVTIEKQKEQLAQSTKALKAVESLQFDVDKYRGELEEAKAANEKTLAELKAAYEASLKASKKEIASLKDQLATSRTEVQELKDSQLSCVPQGPDDEF